MWWKTAGHRELYRLLLFWWDPIEIKDIPEAHDEYCGYSGTLGRLLREGASADDLANYLCEAEAHVGLTPIKDRARLVATKLLDWYGEATSRS